LYIDIIEDGVDYLYQVIDFFLHIDKHLDAIIQVYGVWTYAILLLVIFCETGLVVTPFLPGDSLLFAAGALAARGSLDVWTVGMLIFVAAVGGDAINYSIGKFIGPKVFEWKDSRIFKKEYLDRTSRFYEKYGGKTIVIARFVPIIRTFAPFLAGVGKMNYRHFAIYNITGGFLWTVLFVGGGYLFSDLPIVKNNFSLVILMIIIISVIPALVEAWRARKAGSA
jgi:membrane-associated protein